MFRNDVIVCCEEIDRLATVARISNGTENSGKNLTKNINSPMFPPKFFQIFDDMRLSQKIIQWVI